MIAWEKAYTSNKKKKGDSLMILNLTSNTYTEEVDIAGGVGRMNFWEAGKYFQIFSDQMSSCIFCMLCIAFVVPRNSVTPPSV